MRWDFAEEGGLVACFSQHFWKDGLVPIEAVAIVHEAILVAMLSGQDDGATGPTNGIGAKAFFKNHSLRSKLVDFGSGVQRFQPTFISPDGLGGMVVREDENDIGSLLRKKTARQ